MAFLILSLSLLVFIVYFYAIGVWYLGAVPVVVLLVFFIYYGLANQIKQGSSYVLQKYSLYLAWTVLLAGLLGVFNFFAIDLMSTSMLLVGINTLLR